MPAYDGKQLTIKVTVTVWGVPVHLEGTVEILDIRKQVNG